MMLETKTKSKCVQDRDANTSLLHRMVIDGGGRMSSRNSNSMMARWKEKNEAIGREITNYFERLYSKENNHRSFIEGIKWAPIPMDKAQSMETI